MEGSPRNLLRNQLPRRFVYTFTALLRSETLKRTGQAGAEDEKVGTPGSERVGPS